MIKVKLTKFQCEALISLPPRPFDVTGIPRDVDEFLIKLWKPEDWKIASRPRIVSNQLIFDDGPCAEEFWIWLKDMTALNSGSYKRSFSNLTEKVVDQLRTGYWADKERKRRGLEVIFDEDECGSETGRFAGNRCPKCKGDGIRIGILLWCDNCKDHFEVGK
jgi:hypothetical protein